MDRRTLIAGLAASLATAPRALQAQSAPITVLAFGDSLTAGYGLPEGEGFISKLAAWVAGHGHRNVRFINAGLSGDTSLGGRIRIGWALRRQPDAVMVELGANDMLTRGDPAQTARNLDAIITAAKAGGRPVMLLGVHAAGTDRDFRRRWDAMWPEVAARHDVLLVQDLYATIRAQPVDQRPAYLQSDHLHASPKGVATMVDLAGPPVLTLIDRAEAWSRSRTAAAAAG